VWQPAFFTLLPFLSVAGIAIACVSIYSQAFLIKQWCALCIGMAAILALQGVQSFFLIRILYPASVFFFSLILFSLSLILFPVKLLVKNILSAGPRLSELKKWKSNFDLFVLQLKNGKTVDTTVWENDLLIGDVHSPVLITVVCNPFCHPCAAAHKQLEEMLNHFQGKIAVQLRLLCNPEIEKDKRTAAVRSLLQKALQINNDELQCMLADWFEWMDHEKWNHKWKPDERLGVDHLVNKHRAWIKEAGVNHTPACPEDMV
jgi:thiol-disulfide isomerase/thioredoxin